MVIFRQKDCNIKNDKVWQFNNSIMQQKYVLYWQHTMQNCNKLEFFNTLRSNYLLSSCLGLTNKLSERKDLVKFKLGNHKLRVKIGRSDKIPRANRFCRE